MSVVYTVNTLSAIYQFLTNLLHSLAITCQSCFWYDVKEMISFYIPNIKKYTYGIPSYFSVINDFSDMYIFVIANEKAMTIATNCQNIVAMSLMILNKAI